MVDYTYSYLIWTSLFLLIWLILFLWRKDIRKEMFIISLLLGIGGIISEFTHVKDWWQPLTITNTPLGIEDFLIGFFIGGILSVAYEFIFNKKIKQKKLKLNLKTNYLMIYFPLVFLFSFYILNLHSFYACIIAFSTSIFFIYYKRKDLIKDSMFSGLISLAIGITSYFIITLIYPEFISKFWYLPNYWFSYTLLKIPLAEYIWFFLAGAFIGPLYEYWQEAKLINIKK